VPPNASLFIFARAPGGAPGGRDPRSRERVAGSFTLSDSNSMIPGRSLADFEELTLVAPVGQRPADRAAWGPYAQTVFRPKEGGTVALVIDQVVQ
jgi:hypothetical protein